MSEGNPAKEHYTVRVAAAVITACLGCLLVWLSYGQIHNDERANASAQQEYESRIECISSGNIAAQIACLDKAEATSHEQSTEYYDLKAQQEMSKWALLMLVVTSVGVVFVALTLREARDATNAARSTIAVTRDASYHQLRPYVDLDEIEVVKDHIGWHIQPIWKNFGQTPAINALTMLGWQELREAPGHDFIYPDSTSDPTHQRLPPQHRVNVNGPLMENERVIRLGHSAQQGLFLYVWGWIEYSDALRPDDRHRTEFCSRFAVSLTRDRYVFSAIGPHNGAGPECLKKSHT